jgi:prevent-host-death family protein
LEEATFGALAVQAFSQRPRLLRGRSGGGSIRSTARRSLTWHDEPEPVEVDVLPLETTRLAAPRAGVAAPTDGIGPSGEVYAIGTLTAAKTIPVREFRSRLSEVVTDVADRREHVVVTRNGKPAAVLVPIDEYEALEETAEILSDSDTLAAIDAGLAELSRDETIPLTELRRELAERRTTG